jgi:hypothetical protein
MRAAATIKPIADNIVAEFDAADTREAYGKPLAAIGDDSRFTDDERGDIARAMTRALSRVMKFPA